MVTYGNPFRETGRENEAVSVLVVMHGEDFVERIFVGVDVDHPAEDYGLEAAAGGIAGIRCGDGTFQAEPGPVRVAKLLALGWHTKIRV